MSSRWKIPEFLNIGVACADVGASNHPDKIAMIVEDDTRGEQKINYGELAELSSRFAAALQLLCIGKSERVLLRLPNSIEYPIAFFGTLKAGCIAVPSSTLLTASELVYLAKDSGAQVLVAHIDMWSELAPALSTMNSLRYVLLSGCETLPTQLRPGHCKLFSLDRLLKDCAPIAEPVKTRSADPAYLVYTSGTTGYPKGVLHAHRALLGRVPAATHWFDFRDGDRILHSGKFNWTYVLGTALMDPLYHGHTVIAHEGKNDPELWTGLIAKHGCTIFIGVPTIFRQILQKTTKNKRDVPSLRHCMCAGEHLSDDVLLDWRRRFNQPIYEAIGMSEFSYYISQPPGLPIQPGAAGLPQPGHAIKLIDENFKEVARGEEGMIAIPLDDPGLFLHYWQLPSEDNRLRKNGFFLTGDYAFKDPNGYIWFMGRKDDIIKSFGYRVSPHEIERVLKSHPGVADCVVLGQAIDATKTLVVACIIARPDVAVQEIDLLTLAQAQLASYKIPKRFYFMTDFPRTKNGKVLRKQLLQQLPIAASN